MKRNEFRALAKATLRTLQAGSRSPERKLIEGVSETLVEWATALEKMLCNPEHMASLSRVGPYNTWQPDAIGIGAADPTGAAHAASDRQSVQHIASRPWRDLVCLDDYFELSTGLNLKLGTVQVGDLHDRQLLQFTGFGNSDLLSPGNRIVQALFLRIEHWNEALRSIHVRCQTALNHQHSTCSNQLERANAAAAQFQRLLGQLRRVLIGSTTARLIEDAMVLVQIYADYFPDIELDWLPVPAACRRPQGYAYWLGQREHLAIADRTADAIDRMGNALDGDVDVDLWVELLRNSTPLLLISGSGRRECYWKGSQIDETLQKNEVVWLLLLRLALAAKQGPNIGIRQAEDDSTKTPKYTRARLKKLIPTELNNLIKDQPPGGYVLLLSPSDVSVIEVASEERLTFA
ncbi:MAG: hypothetical protein L0Z50_39800 [Verrucomicrobiales bacterium]|nr:hypothetical protein [Verrucomicrobiales bacterium]